MLFPLKYSKKTVDNIIFHKSNMAANPHWSENKIVIFYLANIFS